MRSHRVSWDEEKFKIAVASNISIKGVLTTLGIGISGSAYARVHEMVTELQLDRSHWLGQAHLRGKTHAWNTRHSLEEILVEHSQYGSSAGVKFRLIRAGLLKLECSDCGLINWRGRPLTLHLDHINGKKFDHRLENLRLLCPNCHSQTPTFGSKNIAYQRIQSAK